jgi:hypothetical protein
MINLINNALALLTGLNTGSTTYSNNNLNLAASFTDDDLFAGEQFNVSWPDSSSRLNHCVIRFSNEAENFVEDSAEWPPKANGVIKKGIGGTYYNQQSGWDEAVNTSANRLLNSLAIWSGEAGDGADGTRSFTWKFSPEASGDYSLTFTGDDSITISISGPAGTVYSGSVGYPNVGQVNSSIYLDSNSVYTISISGNDTGSLEGVAARLYSSSLEVWSTRSPAYTDILIINNSNAVYQALLAEDSGVELTEDIYAEGICDYYHALAKAEELVRTSRTAFTVDFKYIVKQNFLEPGDYIKINSERLSLQDLYLRVNEIKYEASAICTVNATRFDWTQLAWNVKDDQLILPENLYNFEIDSPTNVTLNSADTTLEGTIGKLSWSGVFSEVTGYIVYIAPVVNNQIGEYQEIGRTNNTYFSVPPFNYINVAFGVRSYTTLGKKSNIVSTGILQVTQNYKRDLTISSNHLVFIQEAYTTNFTTPSIVLTAVARGFSNPTYQWYLNDQLISGSALKTLQIEPYLGAPRYYKARVSEFKPGVETATEVLEYTVLIQSRKESIRATINTNPSLPPSPPTNFNITALYNSIRMTWTIPTYTEGGGHGYTDVYYAPMTNSFENWTAIQTGLTQAVNNQTPGSTIFKEVFNGRMLGDIDNSNSVTSTDVTIITNFLAGTATEAQQTYINQVLRPQLQTDITGKYSAYFNYNTQPALTTLLSSLIKISSVEGNTNSYIFSGDPNTNYLFALKEVNKEGVESTPFSNRLGALTSPNSTKLLETLSSKIDSTQLSTTLNSRVNLIDAPTTGLVTKVSTLENTTTSLSSSVTTLSARTNSVGQYGEGFSAYRTFNFDSTTESFSISNATLSWRGSVNSLEISNTSGLAIILSKTFTISERFDGQYAPVMRMRIKKASGTSNIGWLGELRYTTNSHSASTAYRKIIPLPTGVVTNSSGVTDWFIAEWDMSQLNNGGTDWINSDIYGISLYLYQSAGNTWYIDWIAFGTKSVNIYQALYNQEVITRTEADNSLALEVVTIQSSLNDMNVSVQQKMTTRAENGNLIGAYSLVIDNNGILSGFGLESEVNTQTGASQSIFGVNADKFFIANPTATNTRVKPFIVADGIVYIDTARIQDGSIANAKIGNLSADKITSGFISVDRITANSITAAKINSNGLSIYSADGQTLLFNAGSATPISYSQVGGTKPPTDAISASARTVLSGGGGFAAGSLDWNSSGIRTSGSGIGFTQNGIAAYNANGNVTFSLNATTGAAYFAGTLDAASGTFGGSLSAATGTFSGSLTADAINAVNTINIANQAVTIPSSSYTTSASTFTQGTVWHDVQTLTYTSSGAPTLVTYSFTYNGTGTGSNSLMNVRIIRGTTEIYFAAVSLGENLPLSASVLDINTTTGSRTYKVQLSVQTSFGSMTVTNRSLTTLEVKR